MIEINQSLKRCLFSVFYYLCLNYKNLSLFKVRDNVIMRYYLIEKQNNQVS